MGKYSSMFLELFLDMRVIPTYAGIEIIYVCVVTLICVFVCFSSIPRFVKFFVSEFP